MRSFQIVEDKIKETDFFLSKLEESTHTKDVFFGARFYLSAFLSASRSITFSLQAAMKDIPDFEEWYEQHQNKLRQNNLARYFLEVRNLSQKVGYYPLSSFRCSSDGSGKFKNLEYYFGDFPDDSIGCSVSTSWTETEGIPYEERIRMLRQHFEKDVTIDYVFEKYLGTNRLGEKI